MLMNSFGLFVFVIGHKVGTLYDHHMQFYLSNVLEIIIKCASTYFQKIVNFVEIHHIVT